MKTSTKKLLLAILSVIASVCLALGIAACADKTDDPDDPIVGGTSGTLAAPVISLDEKTGVISWEAVENAARYIIYEDDEMLTNVTVCSYTIEQTTPGTYTYAVTAFASGYKTSAKSNEVSYTVTGSQQGGEEKPHEHTYEYEDLGDGLHHAKTCTGGDYSSIEEHVYDDEKDTTCNLCDYVRTIEKPHDPDCEHDYVYEQKDDTYHHVTCSKCDYSEDLEHEYDDDEDDTCDLCGYERELNAPEHTEHDFVYEEDDAYYHKVTCTGCDYLDYESHDYEYARKDETNHTVSCSKCEYSEDVGHEYDNNADTTCNDCGYVRTLVPGSTSSNPIVLSSIVGTHSTEDLQEAYFRLPLASDDTTQYIIKLEPGVEAWLTDPLSGSTTTLYDEDFVDIPMLGLSGPIIRVKAPEGTLCSFTIEVYVKPVDYLTPENPVTVDLAASGVTVMLGEITPGSYTLYVGVSDSALNISAIVGSQSYTLTYANYQFSAVITLDGEESIIISSSEIYASVKISLEAYEEDPVLGIGDHVNVKIKLGPYDNNFNYQLQLAEDVVAGDYLLTFEFTSNHYNVYVITTEKGRSVELGTQNGYTSASASIRLDEGATSYLTIKLKSNVAGNQTISFVANLEVDESAAGKNILSLGESIELSIPYSVDQGVTIDFDSSVKTGSKYKLTVKPDPGQESNSIYLWTSIDDFNANSNSQKLTYNEGTGLYELKFENETGYVILRHTDLDHRYDLDATVSIVEAAFGIGDSLNTEDLGAAQVANLDYHVPIDSSIPNGTELILTAVRTGSTRVTWIKVSTDGTSASDKEQHDLDTNGSATIEFTKECDELILRASTSSIVGSHFLLYLNAKNAAGGEEEGEADTTGFVYIHKAGSLKMTNDGGIEYDIPLGEANLPAGKGEYTFRVVISSPSTGLSYTQGAKVTPKGSTPVTVGSGDLSSGSNEATLTLSSTCKTLTFSITMSNLYGGSANFTFYLYGPGADLGDEGGEEEGDPTTLTKELTFIESADGQSIDISGLEAGTYDVTISVTGGDWNGTPQFNLYFSPAAITTLTQGETAEFEISGESSVWLSAKNLNWTGASATVTITFTKQAEGLTGGGDKTYLNESATIGGYWSAGELDVSELAYGEYTIWFQYNDFVLDEEAVYFTCGTPNDDVDPSIACKTFGQTIIINGPTLYIYSFGSVQGASISIELEKVN